MIPDGTNRAATGVSLEHAHRIAQNIAQSGFDVDHDVPVVVRENVREMLRSEAYARVGAVHARERGGVTGDVGESVGRRALGVFDVGLESFKSRVKTH